MVTFSGTIFFICKQRNGLELDPSFERLHDGDPAAAAGLGGRVGDDVGQSGLHPELLQPQAASQERVRQGEREEFSSGVEAKRDRLDKEPRMFFCIKLCSFKLVI